VQGVVEVGHTELQAEHTGQGLDTDLAEYIGPAGYTQWAGAAYSSRLIYYKYTFC